MIVLYETPKNMPVLIYDSGYDEYIETKKIEADSDTVEDELIIVSE